MGWRKQENLRLLIDCSTASLIFFCVNFHSIKEDGFIHNVLSFIHSLASPQSMYYIAGPLLGVKDGRIQEWSVTYKEYTTSLSFPGGAVVKNPHTNTGDARDVGLIPGMERSPGVGNGYLLQYSCLENSTDRGACRLQSMALQSQIWLSKHTQIQFPTGVPDEMGQQTERPGWGRAMWVQMKRPTFPREKQQRTSGRSGKGEAGWLCDPRAILVEQRNI